MKLIKAHVQNYRNVLDSNEFDIAQTTCLVGKNEAGKSAFLKALEGLRSVDKGYDKFNKVENYPRRFYADYDTKHAGSEAKVIETSWLIEAADIQAVEKELGSGVLSGDVVRVTKRYEQTGSEWDVPLDEAKVVQSLLNRLKLTEEERAPLKTALETRELYNLLQGINEPTANQASLMSVIDKFRSKDAQLKVIDVISARTPKFMYFSHYDRMSGAISINQMNLDAQQGKPIGTEDRVFIDFVEYAGTSLEDLKETTQFEELNAKCEAAALRITDQIFEYWTQNDELKIKVVFSEGKSGDAAPFNAGLVARARVENGLHGVTVPFSERSAGFIWFFSFLVKFAQIQKTHGDVILLLDEPGLTLHGTAQKDLLRFFFEQIAPKHQLIWSTHSPFMVPADDLACVRTVEDVVTLDRRSRKSSIGTKIRSDVLTTDPQTNFPIFGAMGFEITQTLIIGSNTLLVEGPSDILYLQAASNELKRLGRTHLSPNWALCPSGGIDKVLPFVKLFYGNRLNIAVLTDYERGQKKKLDDLHKAALLDNEHILLATDITNKSEADIEEFFEVGLFVQILNDCYKLRGKHELTAAKLIDSDKNTERLVKKAEAYFRVLPAEIPEFSHYEPSLYLLQHPELLTAGNEGVEATLVRFEDAFGRLNRFV